MPPHLKKSIYQVHLESGTLEQIVSRLESELELNGWEAPDQVQINTVTQQATQQKSEKLKPTCHHCKRPGHYRNQCRQLKRDKKPKKTRRVPTIPTVTMVAVEQTLTPSVKFPTISTQKIQIIKKTDNLDLSIYPVRPVVKLTTPKRNVTLEQMQQTDRLPGLDDRNDKTKSNREMLKATQTSISTRRPKI